jgi:hypothetical protein
MYLARVFLRRTRPAVFGYYAIICIYLLPFMIVLQVAILCPYDPVRLLQFVRSGFC